VEIGYELLHVCASLRSSAWVDSAATGWIFMKFGKDSM
jgi:hypothetical protein